MIHKHNLADLVIANGTTDSNAIDLGRHSPVGRMTIGAPATLPETVNVEVSFDNGTTWHMLKFENTTTDILIAAGKAYVLRYGGWDRIRLKATANVGGARTFKAGAVEEV